MKGSNYKYIEFISFNKDTIQEHKKIEQLDNFHSWLL